ncbi:hypothetical protein [Acinetobacter bereziniae]|uniref:hypothetical protein n=1 Tax=Acinetobacter bereziniae TaxID=106648 RepID=UPI00300AC584
MSNYPKALYLGNKKNREYAQAESHTHEQELRTNGYVEFSQLPEYVQGSEVDSKDIKYSSGTELNSDELNQIKKELLDSLKKNESLEVQLQTTQSEYISKVNELQKENSILKFNAMDATELKEILDSKEVKYGSRDGKDVLVALVIEAIYPKEGE